MKKRQHEKLGNQRWWPRSGCSGLIMVKFLVTTIEANLCCLLQLGISTKIHLNFKKNCHYQTTKATSGLPPLISQLFSCCLFLHGPHLFYSLAVFV